MKQLKVFLSLVIVVAALFASSLPAYAIDFDAEETYESVFIVCSGNALGSGFAIGSNCIVTNAHVIQAPKHVTVRSYDGKERAAQVVGLDENQDIAVLIVNDVEFPVLTIADSENIRTGDDVYAIGAPKSMAYTLTKGVISAKERKIGQHTYIQTDAPINEGSSGGPLLNSRGEVLGMNTLKMTDSEGLGLAIPANSICEYLTNLEIALDDSGNVSGPVGNIKPTEEIPEEPATRNDVQEEGVSGVTIFAFVIAGISIALNVALVALLINQKNKNLTLKYDPRERTDFEIDILE